MRLSRILRLALFALLVLGLLGIGVKQAHAHAVLERSDPADNAVLETPPQKVRLWFSEAIEVKFSSVQILDIDGKAVTGLELSLDATDPTLVIVDLPELGQGVYTLNWRVLSASDGHTSQGVITFGIHQELSGEAGKSTSTDKPDPLQAGTRGLFDVVVGSLFGLLLAGLVFLFPPSGEGGFILLRDRAVWVSLVLAIGGILAGGLQLLAQSIVTTGALDGGVILQLLIGTSWGTLWLAREVLLLIVAAWLLIMLIRIIQPSKRAAWGIGLVLSAIPPALSVFSSHAVNLPHELFSVGLAYLHILAASMWVGGLIGLAVVLIPVRLASAEISAAFGQIWGAFGSYALLAVTAALGTGLLGAPEFVVNTAGLGGSAYGRTLLGKLGLIGVVGVLGLVNTVTLHPRVQERVLPAGIRKRVEHAARLPLTISLEAGLGLLIFLLAGMLASTPPANALAYQYASLTQLGSLTNVSNDVLVTLAVHPNQPGQNVIEVRATPIQLPIQAEIIRVIARITYLGKDLGTQSVDLIPVESDPNGLYRAGGNFFSLPGPWKVEVIVRRMGLSDNKTLFNWNVLSPYASGTGFNLSTKIPGRVLGVLILCCGSWFAIWRIRKPR